RRQVTVIVATGGPGPALAAKAATATIPIVFTGGGDPGRNGLVANLSRPGGKATGITPIFGQPEAKRLGVFAEVGPKAVAIGMLVNPNFPDAETQSRRVQNAALALGLQLHIQNASTEADFDAVFATFIKQRIGALFVGNDVLFLSRRKQLSALAARH